MTSPPSTTQTKMSSGLSGWLLKLEWPSARRHRNPDYRRRLDERRDHAKGESSRDKRDAGATEVTVTGTLHGKVFEDDVDVFLTIGY